MNKFTVKIGNTDYSNAIFPFKYGDFLDEQLDYATLTLTRVKKAYFAPATPVFIEIESVTNGTRKFKRLQYAIATDNAVESPVGSGEYRHNLTLIEPTKYLELPLETLCFTNSQVKEYKQETSPYTVDNPINADYEVYLENIFTPTKNNTVQLPAPNLIFMYESGARPQAGSKITVIAKDGLKTYDNPYISPWIELKNGINEITYDLQFVAQVQHVIIKFIIVYIPSMKPLIPWSVQDVINRILELQKPLRINGNNYLQQPRFRFDLSNIPQEKQRLFTDYNSPEFTFTRNTLREALQKIGGFIHAEPRLIWNEETQEFDTITFDFYGESEYAYYDDINDGRKRLSGYNYENVTNKWNIEQGCNELDAYIDNLVNRLNSQTATVGQPYEKGYQTFRTENAYLRYQDDGSMFFSSQYPIYEIQKFTLLYNGTDYDLTPYIYEKAIYDSQLSSFDAVYPISKAYALYYSLGQNGLRGFFFKNTEISGGAFANYSIVNIINLVTGENISQNLDTYKNLLFSLTYTPIYSSRINHAKTYLEDWLPTDRALNYSQGDNQVEVAYFGENIKGAIERLGTLERLITFTCFNIDTIPKAGLLWDNNYCIATVSVEVMQDKFKVTCGLSKNFNRLSKYIGVSSYKRIYEVSERMVQERNVLWKDYIVIDDENATPPQNDGINCLQTEFWVGLAAELTDAVYTNSKVASFVLVGYTKAQEEISQVLLPAISAAEGNTIEYSTEYQDNFSAGQKQVNLSNGDSYGVEVEYGDYYGRLYYLRWYAVRGKTNTADAQNYPAITDYTTYTIGNYPIMGTDSFYQILRKDSREKIKLTAGVQFVAKNKDYVIGSSLATYHPSVIRVDNPAILVGLKKPIGRFEKIIDQSNIAWTYGEINSANATFSYTDGFRLGNIEAFENYGEAAAWAIITPYQTKTVEYSNENGEIVSITETTGGELLIGKNGVISGKNGTIICNGFRAYAVHDIINFLKNN